MTRYDGPREGAHEVVVTDLQMLSSDDLRAAREPAEVPSLLRAGRPAPELSRFLYRAVGGDWYWLDRIDWSRQQWHEWVSRPGHELWTAWLDGVPVGYFELLRDPDGSVEVAYFGLLADFTGQGLGGWLLTEAVRRAWAQEGTARVWLHTCELDSPAAVSNYTARGFVPCGTYLQWWDTREPSPGPWRGSRS